MISALYHSRKSTFGQPMSKNCLDKLGLSYYLGQKSYIDCQEEIKMKKTLSLLLSLALVGSLAACGPKAPEAIPPASL